MVQINTSQVRGVVQMNTRGVGYVIKTERGERSGSDLPKTCPIHIF